MTNNRIVDHPVLGKLENQTPVTFTFDGHTYTRISKAIQSLRHCLQMAFANYAFMKKPVHRAQFIATSGIVLNVASRLMNAERRSCMHDNYSRKYES